MNCIKSDHKSGQWPIQLLWWPLQTLLRAWGGSGPCLHLTLGQRHLSTVPQAAFSYRWVQLYNRNETIKICNALSNISNNIHVLCKNFEAWFRNETEDHIFYKSDNSLKVCWFMEQRFSQIKVYFFTNTKLKTDCSDVLSDTRGQQQLRKDKPVHASIETDQSQSSVVQVELWPIFRTAQVVG